MGRKPFKWIKFIKNYNTTRLGNKQEPYIKTESEMLFKINYTYESLSKEEKEIYNQNKIKEND